MLRNINGLSAQACVNEALPRVQNRYDRNEKDDLKTAIDALYEFKKRLDELHPNCLDIIDTMLQRTRY